MIFKEKPTFLLLPLSLQCMRKKLLRLRRRRKKEEEYSSLLSSSSLFPLLVHSLRQVSSTWFLPLKKERKKRNSQIFCLLPRVFSSLAHITSNSFLICRCPPSRRPARRGRDGRPSGAAGCAERRPRPPRGPRHHLPGLAQEGEGQAGGLQDAAAVPLRSAKVGQRS